MLRLLGPLVCLFILARPANAHDAAPITLLTNLPQILALGTNIPDGCYQARVRGVVTYVPFGNTRVYVQEGDLAAQVNLTGSSNRHSIGALLEITGTVLGGDPTLRLGEARAVVLGNAPLPEPKLVSPHRLIKGDDAFRYVKVQGMVRDMYSNKAGLTLLLTHDGYPFEATLQSANAPLPREWTDAEIEVTGHCNPTYSSRTGQPKSIHFYATGTNDVRVITPGIADRFEGRELLTIATAARLPNNLKPRYRVSGTVTAHHPGSGFFIDDGTGVMFVDTTFGFLKPPPESQRLEREPQTQLEPGERVEVIGARHNWFALTPSLMATEFRRLGRVTEPVKPIPVTLPELQDGRHAGRLVTLRAQLVDQRRLARSNLSQSLDLILRVDDDVFQARWDGDTSVRWELPPEGYVQIVGINHAEGSAHRQRGTFKVLLRSPADVTPVAAPAFWMRRDVQRLALAVGAMTILAGGWILAQRWQVRRLESQVAGQTAELRGEVAARRRAEAELRQSLATEKELNELKGNFVSLVSHEFRTPLEVILSSADILTRYLERLTPEKRAEYLADIQDSVKRMSAMMHDVLFLGRLEAGKQEFKPRTVPLRGFCERVIDELQSATGRDGRIDLRIQGEIEGAQGDESLLRHILVNLLSNALKYSPEDTPVELTLSRANGDVVFTVADRGRGIPAADQPGLFRSFQRGSNVSDTPGTGLGLLLVRKCVEIHHGQIRFESAEGQGTTFTVVLPLFSPPACKPTPLFTS
jgi:signal transduction histidine kinase